MTKWLRKRGENNMGRMSDIPSRRTRNKEQGRRLRIGLVTGSVLAVSALVLFAVWLIRSDDKAAVSVSSSDILVETEKMMTEYQAEGNASSHEITAKTYAEDSTGARVTGQVTPGTVTPSKAVVTSGGTVTLKAVAKAGYTFKEWKLGNTSVSSNSVLTLTIGASDPAQIEYTAVFINNSARVIWKCDPEYGGTLQNTTDSIVCTGTTILKTTLDTLEASVTKTPEDSYEFSGWRLGNLLQNQDDSYTIIDPDAPVELTALFSKKAGTRTITLVSAVGGELSIVNGKAKPTQTTSKVPNGSSSATQVIGNTNLYFTAIGYSYISFGSDDTDPHNNLNIVRIFPNGSPYPATEGTSSSNPPSELFVFDSWYKSDTDVEDDRQRKSIQIEVNVSLLPTGDDDLYYIVEPHQRNYHSSVVTVASPPEGGTTGGDMTATTLQSVNTTISATPNKGYMFDHWEYYDDNFNGPRISTKQSMQVSVSGQHVYVAYFVKDSYKVKANSDPEGGGTISGAGTYAAHSDATLVAEPNAGYVFDKWTWTTEDGKDHEEKNASLTIRDISEDYDLTAHFKKANPVITLSVNPIGAGNNVFNYARMTDGANEYTTPDTGTVTGTVSGGASVTFQAFANEDEDYVFAYWVDQDGNTYNANPYVAGNITDDANYIAVFTKKKDKYDVKAISDPDGGGIFTGEGKYDPHSNATVTATPGPGYEFDKWTWRTSDGFDHEKTDNPVTLTDIMEDYTLTAHFYKASPKVTINASPVDVAGNGYNYVTATDTDGNTAKTDESGTGSLTAAGSSPVTLTAFPNDSEDYVFSYWVNQDGNTVTANPYVIGKVTKDEEYTAIFTKKQDKYEIKLIADPDEGGTLTGAGKYTYHQSGVYIEAAANAGYKFDKWTWTTVDGTVHEFDDARMEIEDIQENLVYTAHFIKTQPTVTVTVSPVDEADGKYNYATITDTGGKSETTSAGGSASLTTTGEESVTLQAFANEDEEYVFSYWVDKDGNTNPANPYVIGRIKEDEKYTAIFTKKKEKYQVRLVAVPDEGGTLTGDGSYDIHDDVTVTAKANDGYTFDKWTWKEIDGSEHESTKAEMVINDIREDHVLTAHFLKSSPRITVNVSPTGEKKGSFNYAEITDTDGHSKTTGEGGTASLKVTGGAAVTLKAVANKDGHYKFAYWVDDDGNVSSSNPYAIGSASKDMTFTAVFISDSEEEDGGITVLASPPSGGKVSAKKNGKGGYNIKAKANRGYDFKYWKCVDTKKTVTKERSFTISKEEASKCYTYIAYFEGDGGKMTSDLIDEYFPNIRRLFEQPNYKYTRESWISTITGLIAALRAESKPASGVPATYSAYSGAQTAMDEKAKDAGTPVITAVGELITTDNEVIPITAIKEHGNADERAAQITTGKFGDHYTCDVMCVARVTAPDGFDDGVRTYLWYNTGATVNDNMFIIYELDGKEQTVTPISDSQGVLTFTLDKLGEVNRFVLVRVVIR